MDKDAFRSGILSFVLTLLFLLFVAGTSAVLFRSAAVLYGGEKAFSVREEGDAMVFTILSEEKTLSRPAAEDTLSEILAFSPFLPSPLRFFCLSAGFLLTGADRLSSE